MTTLRQAAQQALSTLMMYQAFIKKGGLTFRHGEEAITVLRQALEAEQSAEGVTKLPDGSAFAVMSYPLPKNHWLYAPRQYAPGAEGPIELPEPILNHEVRDTVVAAIRYAIRGATMCGQEPDFDPDALVQNAVYALCGAYTNPQPVQQPLTVTADAYDRLEALCQSQAKRIMDLEDSIQQPAQQPLSPQSDIPLTAEQLTVFKYGWKCAEEAHGIKEST